MMVVVQFHSLLRDKKNTDANSSWNAFLLVSHVSSKFSQRFLQLIWVLQNAVALTEMFTLEYSIDLVAKLLFRGPKALGFSVCRRV